jgi:hypothetical protein
LKIFVCGIMLLIAIVGASTLMGQSTPPRVVAEFSGASLKWVHAAEPEFEKKKLDLGNYLISVIEQNDSVVVVLTASDAEKGARGSSGTYPGYEVEIRKNDLKILRSNYVR